MINNKFLLLIVYILSVIIVGCILKHFILKKLQGVVKKTSLDKIILLWSIIIALYLSALYIQLDTKTFLVLQKVLLISFVISLTVIISKIVSELIKHYISTIEKTAFSLFISLSNIIIYLIGILIIFQSLGITITPILTTLGIGGLAVALALQDTLSNLFSGLHILASKNVKVGDYIKLDTGEEGYVVDITWRNTIIKQLSNNLTIIPNSKLSSSIITNYNLPQKELNVLIDIGVSYNSDLEKVEKVTTEVAEEIQRAIPGGVPDFKPFIRYHTFSENSINFTIYLRAKEFIDQHLLKHEFIKLLHKRYKEEGIVIPFPIRTVYLKKEE